MRLALPVTLAALAFAPATLRAAEPISVPAFRSIDLRGGGSIVITPGAAQRVTLVEGNSRVTRLSVDRNGRLTIDACDGRCPANYKLRIEIQAPHVPDVALTGGGAIRAASGFRQQPRISAAISGGGRIDLRALKADAASIAVKRGGEILVHARASLSAAVVGGGAVRYWGNPKVSQVVQGGGWVGRGT